MPFDWREFLIVAHQLRNDPSEGVQRTCLGRAYYYVYHLGLAEARALNFRGQLPGLHRKLWDWRQKHTDPSIKRMGLTDFGCTRSGFTPTMRMRRIPAWHERFEHSCPERRRLRL